MSNNNAFSAHLLHPRYWLTWLGMGLFVGIAYLPWRGRCWLGVQLGNGMYRYNRKRRTVVQINLTLCFPELNAKQRENMARAHFHAYAHALLDYSLLLYRSQDYLAKRARIKGLEHLQQAQASGKNIILLTAHFAWLEFTPAILARHFTLFGFAKPFSNPVLNWLVARSRSRYSAFMLTRDDGLLKVVRSLQPGRCLFYLPDEDLGAKNAVFAPFFHTPKATLTSTARITQLSNALCVPVAVHFNENTGGYEITISPALQNYPTGNALIDATRANAELEQLIRLHPSQYMWTLKLFRTRPNDEPDYY